MHYVILYAAFFNNFAFIQYRMYFTPCNATQCSVESVQFLIVLIVLENKCIVDNNIMQSSNVEGFYLLWLLMELS